jgi:hypothetical protein
MRTLHPDLKNLLQIFRFLSGNKAGNDADNEANNKADDEAYSRRYKAEPGRALRRCTP